MIMSEQTKKKRIKIRKPQRTLVHKHFWTFDIETTNVVTGVDDEGELIYESIIWSGQFYDGVDYYQVRSYRDVIKRLRIIADENESMTKKTLIVVHNLSYEFQFIKDAFEWTNILCTKERTIIAAETDKLCFRCSYLLSNMKLEKFLKNEQVSEEFQKTTMDYEISRFPWTELTPEEEKYCANDVLGLHKAIERRILDAPKEDINNVPLTSTGYVRKDCRKAVAGNKNNRWNFWKHALDIITLNMAHEAFRGGNTHANRWYANKTIGDGLKAEIKAPGVRSFDITSSYPFELLVNGYPGKFFDLKPFKRSEFEYFLEKSDLWGMLIDVTWKDLELTNPYDPVPYISTSKCTQLYFPDEDSNDKKPERDRKKAKCVDNGRLIRAKFCRMIITEVDYKIIKDHYTAGEEKITAVKYAQKHPIPEELADQIRLYYQKKTQLKGLHDPDSEYMYGKSKNLLNGIYGMHVSYPIKYPYYYNKKDHLLHPKEFEIDDETGEKIPITDELLLDQYYNSYSNFLDYQVGVWCTAYARRSLQEMIDVMYNPKYEGKSDLIYVDTDSCKFIHYEDHKEQIEAINRRKRKQAIEHKAYAEKDGITYYLGEFTDEGESKLFKTFGAKKYLYGDDSDFFDSSGKVDKEKVQHYLDLLEPEDPDQEPDIHDCPVTITIAGVSKLEGIKHILRDMLAGKIESPFDLKKGYVFHSIKLAAKYRDHTELHYFDIEGRDVEYGSNVVLLPSSYTLGLSADYEILLEMYHDIMEGIDIEE